MHIYECTVYTSCICTTLNTRCWLKSVQCHNQARPAQIPAGGDHQLMSLVLFQGSCVIIIAERSRLVGSTQREVTTRRLLRSLQRYCCTLHAASRNRENIYYLFCEHASISDIHTHTPAFDDRIESNQNAGGLSPRARARRVPRWPLRRRTKYSSRFRRSNPTR